jgi:DNA polymerase-2
VGAAGLEPRRLDAHGGPAARGPERGTLTPGAERGGERPPATLGFVLQPTYRVREGVPVVQLFGRLESGEAFLVEERRFRPYFFVPRGDERALEGERAARLEPCALRDLAGREVVRVVTDLPASVPRLRERVERAGGRALEADLRFAYRFLVDRGIRAGVAIEGPPERVRPGLVRFRDPELAPAVVRPELRVLSLDLETTPDASRIHAAALVGTGADEVHLVARRPVAGAHGHADERALLLAVAERVRALDPDVLVGWNVVDFDLRVWAARCAALGISDGLGRVDEPIAFQSDPGFGRHSRASLPGRMVLDGIPLVRDAVRLEDYRLETVARAILGRGKLIDQEAPDAAAEIERLFREDPEALAAYNREDARLVLEILEREGLLALAVERSLLSGMQLDRVGASIASFDLLYLPELRRRGVVAPSAEPEREAAPVQGGAVLDPSPGLYRDVAVFDFKSLYPSLVRTFNLDPLAHARAGEDAIAAPNGARFSRSEAILPGILERFMERREAAKRRGDRHADQAIKIMMNALFGVLAASACRFFDPAIANAITGFGQQTLGWTREAFEAAGMRVLYGDTDSVFVLLSPEGAGDARSEAERLRGEVADAVARRIRDAYGVEPRLELELETVYERLLLPHVRGGREGSKKRYAGWAAGRLELVGLESVRRDWPAVAGRLQRGMLERLFTDRDPLPFASETVAGVRSGALDAELVYAKRVRKASLERYTATTPPHVQAARKAGGRAGPVVRYVIARSGPEPVLPGRPLPADIDREHYVEKVLRPVADAILRVLGHDFDDAIGAPRQLTLI